MLIIEARIDRRVNYRARGIQKVQVQIAYVIIEDDFHKVVGGAGIPHSKLEIVYIAVIPIVLVYIQCPYNPGTVVTRPEVRAVETSGKHRVNLLSAVILLVTIRFNYSNFCA